MKRKLFILIQGALYLLSATTANAQETKSQCLIVEGKTGVITEFRLKDAPVITFDATELKVVCLEDELNIGLSDIDNYHFEEKVIDGISNTSATGESFDFAFNSITFSNLSPDTQIIVYNADGSTVLKTTADSNGYANIFLGNLPKGVYIIKTPDNTYKVNNR